MSLEDDRSFARKLWDWIKALFKHLWEKLKGLLSEASVLARKASNVAKRFAGVNKDAVDRFFKEGGERQVNISAAAFAYIKGAESGKLELLAVVDAYYHGNAYGRSLADSLNRKLNDRDDFNKPLDLLVRNTAPKMIFRDGRNTVIASDAAINILNIERLTKPDEIRNNHYISDTLVKSINAPQQMTITFNKASFDKIPVSGKDKENVIRSYSSVFSGEDEIRRLESALKDAQGDVNGIFSKIQLKLEPDRKIIEVIQEAAVLFANINRTILAENKKGLSVYSACLDVFSLIIDDILDIQNNLV